jgi:hypothetical protein
MALSPSPQKAPQSSRPNPGMPAQITHILGHKIKRKQMCKKPGMPQEKRVCPGGRPNYPGKPLPIKSRYVIGACSSFPVIASPVI